MDKCDSESYKFQVWFVGQGERFRTGFHFKRYQTQQEARADFKDRISLFDLNKSIIRKSLDPIG